jgi:hypothetical protein
MTRRLQVICAWCGPAAIAVTLIGWLIAGLLPVPLGPHSSSSEVVKFYAGGSHVAAGLVLSSVGLALVLPLAAVIAVWMLRMEGRTPVLTFLQLGAGAATTVLIQVPVLMMAIAAFRPERSQDLTVLLNDLGWFLLLTPITPFILQDIAIGAAILNDPAETLPRWLGYLNYWVAFLFVPAVLAYFFRTGPFAWDGIFVFWLALTAYAVWLIAMGLCLRRAIIREPADDPNPAPEPASA